MEMTAEFQREFLEFSFFNPFQKLSSVSIKQKFCLKFISEKIPNNLRKNYWYDKSPGKPVFYLFDFLSQWCPRRDSNPRPQD